jgi:SAM-dependent methyltransferase
MENKDIFRDIISDYEAARPGYPDALFQDIISYAGLNPDARILEIGAGPGQATACFVKNQYDLTALEISDKQVQFLKGKFSHCPLFHCECSTFEDYICDPETYDVVFSATAFHWIQPEVGYPKAFNLLKDDGVVAVFWHMASIVEPQTEMLKQIREIYRSFAPELDDYVSLDEAESLHQLRISQIQTQQLFHDPITKIYRWDDEYSTERYLKLMNSYSDFHSIGVGNQKAILKHVADYIGNNGGKIVIPQEVRLYMAKKTD